jgi:hypothetical protein
VTQTKIAKNIENRRFICYNSDMDNEKTLTEIVGNNAKLQTENEALQKENTTLKTLIKWYEEQFRLAAHRRFGASSEKSAMPEQLGLFNEADTTADNKEPEPEPEQIIRVYSKTQSTNCSC